VGASTSVDRVRDGVEVILSHHDGDDDDVEPTAHTPTWPRFTLRAASFSWSRFAFLVAGKRGVSLLVCVHEWDVRCSLSPISTHAAVAMTATTTTHDVAMPTSSRCP